MSVATSARSSGARRGRPVAAVNPLELLTCWEGRGGRRPLSLREIARKLGVSQATARKRLQELREAGEVDDQARARALAARGGLRRGGRPPRPLKDIDLIAAWAQRPTLTAVARTKHVSRPRVHPPLQELGLLLHQGGQGHEPQQVQTREKS